MTTISNSYAEIAKLVGCANVICCLLIFMIFCVTVFVCFSLFHMFAKNYCQGCDCYCLSHLRIILTTNDCSFI
jgi:hypothetical protein